MDAPTDTADEHPDLVCPSGETAQERSFTSGPPLRLPRSRSPAHAGPPQPIRDLRGGRRPRRDLLQPHRGSALLLRVARPPHLRDADRCNDRSGGCRHWERREPTRARRKACDRDPRVSRSSRIHIEASLQQRAEVRPRATASPRAAKEDDSRVRIVGAIHAGEREQARDVLAILEDRQRSTFLVDHLPLPRNVNGQCEMEEVAVALESRWTDGLGACVARYRIDLSRIRLDLVQQINGPFRRE